MSEENTPFDYVVNLILAAVPHEKLPIALRVMLPTLVEIGLGEEVLTEEVRGQLQVRTLRALRAAGLEGVDIG